MKIHLVLILSLGLFLISCAHHRDVRPGNGIHHVVVREQNREAAERNAIDQAEHFCKERNQHAVIIEEKKTEYTGKMDESTRDTVHKASTAAMVLGGGAGGFGPTHGTKTAGAVLGTAGTAGYIMTGGDDYTADMKFKCE